MATKDYTAKSDRWNLGVEDAQRLENVAANIVADHIEHVLNGKIHVFFSTKDGEPVLQLAFEEYDDDVDRIIPLTEVMYDHEDYPETYEKVRAALKEYGER